MTWSKAICEWQVKTFGEATPDRAWGRMLEEFEEMIESVEQQAPNEKMAEEAADVVITLAAFVGTLGKDLADAVQMKMAKNRARIAKLDGTGCAYHVKEPK